jgi:hypothetical protein
MLSNIRPIFGEDYGDPIPPALAPWSGAHLRGGLPGVDPGDFGGGFELLA